MTDAEKIAELRADKEAIITLLRACVQMSDSRCRNTIKEAVRQYETAKLKEITETLA